MNKPSQPPALPKDTDTKSRDNFNRWLYLLWEYITNGTSDDIQSIIPAEVYARSISAPTFNQVSQRILEGQIFGG